MALRRRAFGKDLIEGGPELEKALILLPDKIFKKVMRQATAKAMTPVLKDARKRASNPEVEETGLLAEAMGKRTKLYPRAQVATTNVGPRLGFKRRVDVELNEFEREFGGFLTGQTHKTMTRDPKNYGHLAEGFKQPAKPHVIPGVFGRMTVLHPGVRKATPWLRPALDKGKREVVRIWRGFISRGVLREWSKLV